MEITIIILSLLMIQVCQGIPILPLAVNIASIGTTALSVFAEVTGGDEVQFYQEILPLFENLQDAHDGLTFEMRKLAEVERINEWHEGFNAMYVLLTIFLHILYGSIRLVQYGRRNAAKTDSKNIYSVSSGVSPPESV